MLFVTLAVVLICFCSMISLLFNTFLLIRTEDKIFLKPMWISFGSIAITSTMIIAFFANGYLNFKYDKEENKLYLQYILRENYNVK